MRLGDWFTLALVVQYVIASVVYAADGAWPKALYWVGAAILGTAVLWMR